mgnify:CR=1 FL=1
MRRMQDQRKGREERRERGKEIIPLNEIFGGIISLMSEKCSVCDMGVRVLTNVYGEGNVLRRETTYSCGHKFIEVEIVNTLSPSAALKMEMKSGARVRGKPVREVEHFVKFSGYQLRYVRERTKEETLIFQVGWNMGQIDHLHCKICENQWSAYSNNLLEEHFEIIREKEKLKIRCLKCNSVLLV